MSDPGVVKQVKVQGDAAASAALANLGTRGAQGLPAMADGADHETGGEGLRHVSRTIPQRHILVAANLHWALCALRRGVNPTGELADCFASRLGENELTMIGDACGLALLQLTRPEL
jgi:hypothetical protein